MTSMTTKLVAASLMLFAVVAVLAGCGSSSSSTSGSSSSESSGEPPRVAVLENVLNDFTSVIDAGIKKEVTAAGGSVQEYSAEFEPEKQLTQCQDAVTSQRFNVLIINSVDSPTMATCAKQAGEIGVKVLAVENPIGPSHATIEPQIPEVQGGVLFSLKRDGELNFNLIKAACKGNSNCEVILEIGFAADPLSAIKKSVIEEKAKSDPNIEIVQVLEGKYEPASAAKNTPDALAAHPGVDVFTYEADTSAVAGIEAIEAAGLAGKVKVTTDGGSTTGVKAVEEGRLFGTVGTFPRSMGEAVGKMAVEVAAGKEPPEPAIEAFSLGEPLEVTKANVSQMKPQWGPKE